MGKTVRYVKIKNNMFGDVIWALLFFIQNSKNKKLIVFEGSVLERIMTELGLQGKFLVKRNMAIKILSSSILPKFIYNIYYEYEMEKIHDVDDICYPKPNEFEIKKFEEMLKGSGVNNEWCKEYLKDENRYYRFGMNPNVSFDKSELAKIIIDKHKDIHLDLSEYKPYVVINIKPKTFKQKLGFNGSERNKNQLDDLLPTINYLHNKGYSVFLYNENKIIKKTKEIVNFDMNKGLIKSSYIVKNSSFVISSRTGFTVLPALMGIDIFELNIADMAASISNNTYALIRKNSKARLDKSAVRLIFQSEWFYSSDSHKPDLLKSKYINGPEQILEGVRIYLEKKSEFIINTREISNPSHLFAYTVPYHIILV